MKKSEKSGKSTRKSGNKQSNFNEKKKASRNVPGKTSVPLLRPVPPRLKPVSKKK